MIIDTEDVYVPEYFTWEDMNRVLGKQITKEQYDKILVALKGEDYLRDAVWELVADAVENLADF